MIEHPIEAGNQRQRSGGVNVFGAFFSKFLSDSCFQMAASLSFSTILSLVPIFALSLSVMAGFRFFSSMEDSFRQFLFKFLIPEQSTVIQKMIEDFSKNLSSLNTISIVTFLLTGILLLVTVENNLNKIWGVKNKTSIWMSILIYWAVLTLAPILIGSSFHITNKYLFAQMQPYRHILFQVLSLLLSYAINAAFIFIIYYAMPNIRIRLKAAVIGALVAALLYETLKFFFSLYIHGLNYTKIYGSLAILPIFLGWLYSVWLIFLIGSEIAYFVQYPRRLTTPVGLPRPMGDELSVFLFIVRNYLEDVLTDMKVIQIHFAYLDHVRLGLILEHLLEQKLVIRHDERGYIPYSEPANMKFSDAISAILNVDFLESEAEGLEGRTSHRLASGIEREFRENLAQFVRDNKA